MMLLTFVQCEVHSKLQQKHKIEHLSVQKQADESIVKKHFDAF